MEDSFGLDKHLKPRASDLGEEDLGDGMFQKKVRVHRDASGEVSQLIDADAPLTKAEELAEINGCDGEPHYTEVNIISTSEVSDVS